MSRDEIRENLTSGGTWMRAFFMVIYAIICYVVIHLLLVVIIFQFGIVLLSGKLNERLLPVAQSLTLYIYQILLYLTYNSDEKPFPLGEWPSTTEYNTEQVMNLPKEPEPPQKEPPQNKNTD
jgi:hypothetical protein